MEFAVDALPEGLTLDAATGRITGALKDSGEWTVTLRARNALGSAEKKFRIVAGEKIALTPPMGWNSWNCWGGAVSQEKVLDAARQMVEKGLRDHGWTYVNIDDGWQGVRGGELNAIQPNSKFSDMKALSDAIHAMGLKFGIYSSPWRGTYEGHIGSTSAYPDGVEEWIKSGDHNPFYCIGANDAEREKKRKENWQFGAYSFVERDARQWASWGVDYLKYDWFPNDVPHTREMAQALRNSGRDVIYSLSNRAPYDRAEELSRLATQWRTTGDINDTWKKVVQIGFSQDRWAAYTKPGQWSDPDMLVVGHVGWGPKVRDTRLTPDEQYAHVSLWCLLSAPLLIGCDLSQLDDFTLGLLTNDEVLEINQDPLGKQATQCRNDGRQAIYAKPLEDGSVAVGLFNLSEETMQIEVRFDTYGDLPLIGQKQAVRDLWRQKDIGVFENKFQAEVASHGVILIRMRPVK